MKMIEYKILNFSESPDDQGDIVPGPDAVRVKDGIGIYKDQNLPKNFVTFSRVDVRDDGIYVVAPEESLKRYNGMVMAPEGMIANLERVEADGRECRLIHDMILMSVVIVPGHVDKTIKPLSISDEKSSKVPDKSGGSKITASSGNGGSRRIDSGDKSLSERPRFKRRPSRRNSRHEDNV